MAGVDINPEVLAWAMDESRLGVADLAESTGRDLPTTQSWLDGTGRPYKGDLEALAKRLHRPVQLFLLPAPPASSPFSVNRRTALAGVLEADGDELAAYREANRLQKIARWIVDQTDQAQIAKFPPILGTPEVYAQEVAEWLEWDLSKQLNKSKGRVFRELRSAVEASGTLVLLKKMGHGKSPGFSLVDERVPTIFLNSSYDLGSVRSYTLLHELAHLARGDSQLHHDYSKNLERWCERFAAAFLLPEESLRQYLSKGVVSKLAQDDLNRVRLISDRYGASWQAVSIRLIRLGLAQPDLYDQVKNGEQKQQQGGGPGDEARTTAVLRAEEFGTELARILHAGQRAEIISQLDVLRYLRVSQDQMTDLVQLAGS